MAEGSEVPLSLQAQFTYESLRRAIQEAQDLGELRAAALSAVDYMENQQRVVNQMLRQEWLEPEGSDTSVND